MTYDKEKPKMFKPLKGIPSINDNGRLVDFERLTKAIKGKDCKKVKKKK